MSRIRCALARLQAEPMDKQAIKRDAWRQRGDLVILAEDTNRLDFAMREMYRILGNHLYGDRNGAQER